MPRTLRPRHTSTLLCRSWGYVRERKCPAGGCCPAKRSRLRTAQPWPYTCPLPVCIVAKARREPTTDAWLHDLASRKP